MKKKAMDVEEKLSDIEKLRKENIQKNEEELRKLFPLEKFNGVDLINPAKQPLRRKSGKLSAKVPCEVVRRSSRQSRKRAREPSWTEDDDAMESNDENSKILIHFGSWNKRLKSKRHQIATGKNENSCFDGSDENYCDNSQRRTVKRSIRPMTAVTEEDLILVAERTSDKRYDQIDGTSCHQCRQKTDDLKTVCRSGSCIGIRGQFCGPCLKNRYGECAKQAIMDPHWSCPPCRGICNCSFCMKKRGRTATGILIHAAKKQGYDNVSSYLKLSQV